MSNVYTQPHDEMILTVRIEDEDYKELRAFLDEDPRLKNIRESGMAFDHALGHEMAKVVQILSDHRLHIKIAAEAMEVGKDAIHQLLAAGLSIWVYKQNEKHKKAIDNGEKESLILDASGHRMKISTKAKQQKP